MHMLYQLSYSSIKTVNALSLAFDVIRTNETNYNES